MAKDRLDRLVMQRGLAESREKAQAMILAGQVRLAGQVVTKSGHTHDITSEITVDALPRFVSRGGEKLDAALEQFPVDVEGRCCCDIGASTGGFTDCLLQRGARRVFCVDVGKGILHWRIREDPRVVVMEKTNARRLQAGDVDEAPSLAVVDVSFISLTKVLPAVISILTGGADLVTLIKPQFEAGRDQVGKGGVVRDEAVRAQVVEDIRAAGEQTLGLAWNGVCTSPLKGPAGNVEFLAWWTAPAREL